MDVDPRRTPGIRRGFTLIELLIVIVILLALFGIVAANFMGRAEQADVDVQRVQIKAIQQALKMFKLDLGRYPTQDEGLGVLWDETLLENEEDAAKWTKAYLEDRIEKDKWGGDLLYNNPSELNPDGAEYDIISFGPDQEEGTEDDITNHKVGADGEIESVDDFSVGE